MPQQTWTGPGLTYQEQVDNTCEIDGTTGLASGTLVFTAAYTACLSLGASITTHPDFPFLYRKKVSITREDQGIGRCTISFEGMAPTDYTIDPAVVRSYNVIGSTSSEPVATHPDFETVAGTSNDPVAGAVFEDGKFKEFTDEYDDGGDPARKKMGVKSYLSGGVIYEETTLRRNASSDRLDLTKLGCIDEPPDSPLKPTLHDTRNWLLISAEASRVGNEGVKEVKRWRASGPRGWDPDFYAEAAVNT